MGVVGNVTRWDSTALVGAAPGRGYPGRQAGRREHRQAEVRVYEELQRVRKIFLGLIVRH